MSEKAIRELFKKVDISKGLKIKIYGYSEQVEIFSNKMEIKEGYINFYNNEELVKIVPISIIKRIDILKK